MKQVGALVMAGLIMAGCGKPDTTVVVGENGDKATISQNGQSVTTTDAKGNTATATTNGSGTSYSDSKGNSMTANGSQVTTKSANGDSATIGANISESDLGLPFYPGSSEKKGASMIATQNGVKSVMSSRTTKDLPSKVLDFYKGKVENGKPSNIDSGDNKIIMLSGKSNDGSDVEIMASKNGSADTEILVTVKHKG